MSSKTRGLGSEPILADFGADMVFTTGGGTIIRHFRCRLQRIVSGNGQAAATAPDRFDTQEAAVWRLPGAMLQQADEREAPASRTGRAVT